MSARPLALFVATFTLLVQALVVQLHWHAPAPNVGHVPSASRMLTASTSGTGHESSAHDCIICLEQAMTAHYTLPPLVAFIGDDLHGPDLVEPQPLAALWVRQISHAWHSRGPPLISA